MQCKEMEKYINRRKVTLNKFLQTQANASVPHNAFHETQVGHDVRKSFVISVTKTGLAEVSNIIFPTVFQVRSNIL